MRPTRRTRRFRRRTSSSRPSWRGDDLRGAPPRRTYFAMSPTPVVIGLGLRFSKRSIPSRVSRHEQHGRPTRSPRRLIAPVVQARLCPEAARASRPDRKLRFKSKKEIITRRSDADLRKIMMFFLSSEAQSTTTASPHVPSYPRRLGQRLQRAPPRRGCRREAAADDDRRGHPRPGARPPPIVAVVGTVQPTQGL